MQVQKMFLAVACLLALFAVGCESGEKAKADAPTQTDTKPGAVVGKKTDAKKAPAKAAPKKMGSDAYSVSAKDLSLELGKDGELAIEIKASPGFKINEEFPWKAKFAKFEGIATPEMASKDKWNLTKQVAALKLPVKAEKACDGKLKATLNFSICNDERCEIIRDKEVEVTVAAK